MSRHELLGKGGKDKKPLFKFFYPHPAIGLPGCSPSRISEFKKYIVSLITGGRNTPEVQVWLLERDLLWKVVCIKKKQKSLSALQVREERYFWQRC